MHISQAIFPGRQMAHWTVIESTSKRSKAGSIIYKVKNNLTGQVEEKSAAYLIQYLKRKSKKTFPGRYRHFIRIPLEELQEFGKNLNLVCPKLMRFIENAKITTLKDVGTLFETTKNCAEYGTTKGRILRVQREREQDLLDALKETQKRKAKK